MKLVSLGNNCWWGAVAKAYSMLSASDNFFKKTCFLSSGAMSRNNFNCSKTECVYQFLQNCRTLSWFNKDNIEKRSEKYINYYFCDGIRSLPLFIRHPVEANLDDPDFLRKTIQSIQYWNNPADIYMLKIDSADYLVQLRDLLRIMSPRCRFIVFSDKRIDIPGIECAVLDDIQRCNVRRSGNKHDYSILHADYMKICDTLQIRLPEIFDETYKILV